MKYLVIDALLNGTGIRDKYNGGYIDPHGLGLTTMTIEKLQNWLHEYEQEYYNGYLNKSVIEKLDEEGANISKLIKEELREVKIEYYSDALMTTILI